MGFLDAVISASKKLRSAIDSVADDWVCPITCELPIDPVTAEDGHVYERSAIEAHIRTKRANLRSPITNTKMGPQLLSSTQVRSTIEKLVRTGTVNGDKAKQWSNRIQQEDHVKKIRLDAENGDVSAMHVLGQIYHKGTCGLAEDPVAAYKWFKQSADAGNAPSMAYVGWMLLSSDSVAKNPVYGMGLLFRAASLGSDLAAFQLGLYFDTGLHGLPQDLTQARFWYSQVATSGHSEHAAKRVLELAATMAGASG